MMKMKAKTNNRASKIIVAVALALALIAALVVTSYAWLRNNVAIDSVNVKTGAMLYKITLYHKDKDGNLVKYNGENSKLLYDTGTTANKQDSLTVPISDQNSKLSVKPGEELFFVIEKRDNSIDLDVAVSFEPGLETAQQYDYMGQVDFEMKDISDSFKPSSSDSSVIDAAIKALSVTTDTNNVKSMNAIWSTTQKTASLCSEGETPARKFACVRVAFSLNSKAATPGVSDQEFPLKVKFCVAQKGALPGVESGKTWNVSTAAELKAFMDGYDFNDTLYITKDIKGEDIGDLVFTRPCKIILNRATLQVNGNLIFSYAYDGQFSLDTRSDGHINVLKSGNDAAGIFKIDLPNAKIDLIGANNAAVGKADVYVEGEFEINASNDDDKGISFDRFRVCDVNESLKTINILDTVKISTANRTQLGEIVAIAKTDGFGYSVMIDNRGSIDRINLMDMTQDATLLRTPGIFIDNGGTIGKISGGVAADDSDVILLPKWSQKFSHKTNNTDDTADDTYVGNTRIFANKGSSEMKAITANFITVENDVVSINWPEDSTGTNAEYFSSNRSIKALRDDIEYDVRTVFVEFEKDENGEIEKDGDGNPINVIIHYEEPSSEALSSVPELEALKGASLRDYVKYYDIIGDKTAANYDGTFNADGYQTKFVSVKVICYGEKVLTANDYAFIRTMKTLTTLDLADAVSETQRVVFYDGDNKQNVDEYHKLVPEGAFENMTNLATVIMSESDTAWSPNIFKGTAVDEITFPQALLRLCNERTASGVNKGKVKSQDVLTNVKYVYTSITNVQGVWADADCTQYFFVPDEYTYYLYRSKNTAGNVKWYSKIFINNGVIRYGENGEIFLRYDPEAEKDGDSICEFVVQTDGSKAWVENAKSNYGFDFKKINIDGNDYEIVSYDPYALYNKLCYEPSLVEIAFGAALDTVGEYAFAENSSIGTVNFDQNTDTKLLGYTFYNNESLVSVNALAITTLDGGYNFAKSDIFIKSGRDALVTFNMPMLSVVNGGNDIRGCLRLERVDISVIEWTEINKTFYSAPDVATYDSYNYAKFYIHTEHAKEKDDIKFNKALAADYRYIFVNNEYAYLYTSTDTYTGVANIGNHELSGIREITVDGVSYYYYTDDVFDKDGNLIKKGTNACLVACLSESIDMASEDEYTLVDNFDGYTVNRIGSAAYHFTAMKARVLIIPTSVTEIGPYAFDARKTAFKKYFITLNLNSVVRADIGAFYCVDMVKLEGPQLVEVAQNTLTNNASLIVAKLPKLSQSRPAGTTSDPAYVFEGASSLRIAYISYSDDIRYDNDASRTMGYIRFVNYTSEANEFILPDVNTVIGGIVATPQTYSSSNITCNYINTDKNYSNIYYSDFYDCKFNFNNREESIKLPGYFYYKEINGDMTLIAVSPDVAEFGNWSGSNYTTPSNLYLETDGNYTAVFNGTETKFKITKIGRFAYGFVRFLYNGDVTIGDNISIVDEAAFRNCAYSAKGETYVVLDVVNNLNLAKVVKLGNEACYQGRMKTVEAPMVKEFGKHAFRGSSNLTTLEFPSFERSTGSNVFWGCNSLTSVILGENTQSLTTNMFLQTPKLTDLTILNQTSVVEVVSNITSTGSNITLHIYGGLLSAYQDRYPTTFGGIPIGNIEVFGNAYVENSVVYYWNILNDLAKTAYIDSISGRFDNGTKLTIPSQIDGYTIVAVSSAAMASLKGVSEVTLPSTMSALTFTAADLADSITTLIIGNADNGYNNGTFKTVDGVLYSADGKTLYVYPKAKADESFVVDSSVTQIFDEAFSGVKSLKQLTINSVVTVNDRAFAKSVVLEKIIFTNATASIFAGREILNDANVNLYIYVPSGKLDAYKANVLIDYSILGKILANS